MPFVRRRVSSFTACVRLLLDLGKSSGGVLAHSSTHILMRIDHRFFPLDVYARDVRARLHITKDDITHLFATHPLRALARWNAAPRFGLAWRLTIIERLMAASLRS